MFFTRAIVAAVLAGAAAATPASLHARDQKLTMSYCNGCIPIGEGGVSCVQNFYIHWGDNNLGSCNDSSFLYDDGSCSTSGATIPTPSGDGTWSTSNCGAATDQVLGTISAGGNTYTCYRANDANFSVFCGEDYACSVYASCYGP
ncbi:hypothetical protein BBK36DRAFT_1114798 [Trichoderma citrinoviride]|uniref:SSCRP protein n=1 Tax=Trichoderma citrinoviride TaxID=58853 RepID=A0A2T4BFI9_9HYPO|nr:hypothetical protein BBK36DRAFT_1114798 [Trichoderma citrinoviride]PTB68104.1 hypothetical protein BBK36DRAFT_1114798 [Trichoderma citrinoviride]